MPTCRYALVVFIFLFVFNKYGSLVAFNILPSNKINRNKFNRRHYLGLKVGYCVHVNICILNGHSSITDAVTFQNTGPY